MITKTKKIIIGSRKSPLAQAQVEIFLKELEKKELRKKIIFEKKFFTTTGDKFLNTKISEIGNKGLFTKEIDEAQLSSQIDVSIHSLKDLPTTLPKGLEISAVLPRGDPADIAITKENQSFFELKNGQVVGTSSIRRKIQLQRIKPDLIYKDVRGNVETRISKLKNDGYDAIVLANAGFMRLRLKHNIEKFDLNEIVPAVGQGVIAVVTKKNENINELITMVNDPKTWVECDCERIFLNALDGSCKTPIGAYAKITNKDPSKILFRFMASSFNGKKFIKDETYFHIERYHQQSMNLGKKIKQKI